MPAFPSLAFLRAADGVRVDFAPEATEQDKQQARSLADAFDWSPRRPRSKAALLADIDALAPDDFNTLVKDLLCERLQSDPYWAINQGINLPGDEPEPVMVNISGSAEETSRTSQSTVFSKNEFFHRWTAELKNQENQTNSKQNSTNESVPSRFLSENRTIRLGAETCRVKFSNGPNWVRRFPFQPTKLADLVAFYESLGLTYTRSTTWDDESDLIFVFMTDDNKLTEPTTGEVQAMVDWLNLGNKVLVLVGDYITGTTSYISGLLDDLGTGIEFQDVLIALDRGGCTQQSHSIGSFSPITDNLSDIYHHGVTWQTGGTMIATTEDLVSGEHKPWTSGYNWPTGNSKVIAVGEPEVFEVGCEWLVDPDRNRRFAHNLIPVALGVVWSNPTGCGSGAQDTPAEACGNVPAPANPPYTGGPPVGIPTIPSGSPFGGPGSSGGPGGPGSSPGGSLPSGTTGAKETERNLIDIMLYCYPRYPYSPVSNRPLIGPGNNFRGGYDSNGYGGGGGIPGTSIGGSRGSFGGGGSCGPCCQGGGAGFRPRPTESGQPSLIEPANSVEANGPPTVNISNGNIACVLIITENGVETFRAYFTYSSLAASLTNGFGFGWSSQANRALFSSNPVDIIDGHGASYRYDNRDEVTNVYETPPGTMNQLKLTSTGLDRNSARWVGIRLYQEWCHQRLAQLGTLGLAHLEARRLAQFWLERRLQRAGWAA